MKIECLATLEAVLKHGSLAAAAAERNLAPSTVSMQIKQLEAYFGRPLFDRSALQVRPTPFAIELGEVLPQTLGRIEAMRQKPVSNGTLRGRISVGVIESAQPYLLPGMLEILGRRHPGLEVRPVHGRTVEYLAGLKSGRVDAAVLARPDRGRGGRLCWHPLLREDLVAIAPLAAIGDDLARLLSAYPLILLDRSTATGRLALSHLASIGLSRKPAYLMQSVLAIVAMVGAGQGVSIIRRPDPQTVQGYPIRQIALGPVPPRVELCLVHRQTDANGPILQAVLDALRAVARSAAPGHSGGAGMADALSG